ncbi:hypothetical protein PPL_10107 [Heterostelium album PN500]|uniref:Uncharacterized protein n=1 Tax=Heterostelium pallidum (strain ATCC 26659 / Pp 5 / PN500) TaxID=670386 RepID=D3BQC2_HETP5|nr:hypothetical protein PPL_10107 [Heterostelium album PN500]EFA76342.1 hypothetical protein PPL_10107 [Heterostelium album PN500]|eukprot:XP_020428474.1 hypothetical protein PPL_10107 [Heterostelium album PN500]
MIDWICYAVFNIAGSYDYNVICDKDERYPYEGTLTCLFKCNDH